jgi:hypothetical protein
VIDTNNILFDLLKKTGTPLYTLCGTRIYCGDLPIGWKNTSPSIEFFTRGGTSEKAVENIEPSVHFKCYGGTQTYGEAQAVYCALGDILRALENTVTASGTIMTCQEESVGQQLADPDSGIRYVLTIWRFKMRPA